MSRSTITSGTGSRDRKRMWLRPSARGQRVEGDHPALTHHHGAAGPASPLSICSLSRAEERHTMRLSSPMLTSTSPSGQAALEASFLAEGHRLGLVEEQGAALAVEPDGVAAAQGIDQLRVGHGAERRRCRPEGSPGHGVPGSRTRSARSKVAQRSGPCLELLQDLRQLLGLGHELLPGAGLAGGLEQSDEDLLSDLFFRLADLPQQLQRAPSWASRDR